MFNRSRFNRKRFNGPTATGASTASPVDLFEAVGRFYLASVELQAAGFTGLWADQKPRGEANPVLILKIPDVSKFAGDSDTHWNRIAPSLIVLAETKASADSLVETVIAAFKNQTFVYGLSGEIKTGNWWLRSQRRAKDQGETVGGQKVFRASAEFEGFELRPRY